MCISPNFVWVQLGPKWEQQPVACRQCWRCRKNRVNDYVARSMAEASISEVSCAITLTYADRDDLADKMVTPRHFQLFMKLLRRAGHRVRYLVVGEYGDLKDRAHFHAILFFSHLVPIQYRDEAGKLITRGQTPLYVDDYLPGTLQTDWGPFCREIPQKRMVHIREWPHGHIQVDWNVDEASIRYVCEYVLSDKKKNGWFSLSKKPALGAEWFASKAALAKELHVLPSTFEYLPPGGDRNKSYLMTGATRRDYLAAITTDISDRVRMSEWVQKTFDKHDRARMIAAFEAEEKIRGAEMLDEHFERKSEDAAREARLRHLEKIAEMDAAFDRSPSNQVVLTIHGKWVTFEEMMERKRLEDEKEQKKRLRRGW